jgi:hypothetical protein
MLISKNPISITNCLYLILNRTVLLKYQKVNSGFFHLGSIHRGSISFNTLIKYEFLNTLLLNENDVFLHYE